MSITILSNPYYFMRFASIAQPVCCVLCVCFFITGTYIGLYNSPADYQQGEMVRIMYVHVPAASLSLGFYTFIAISSLIYFFWRHKLADLAAASAAPIGAVVTLIALITGALWGKPTWGTAWVWDARLTSTLLLLFIYAGYIALRHYIDHEEKAARIASLFAMIGFINIPIIKFSVEWWNTLHQPASLLRLTGPSIATEMLIPLILMMIGLVFFFATVVIMSMQTEIMKQSIKRYSAL